jgi:ArsR family transcriptional regulator, lead/cadmium/zinc/bismuth-responsive transcriptional repressor
MTVLDHCAHDNSRGPLRNEYTQKHLDVAAAMCQALSDSARLRLLLLLSKREMCVSELVDYEEAKLSSISARLQTLHAARLVTRRREAKHVFYALADEHVYNLLSNILGHAVETQN